MALRSSAFCTSAPLKASVRPSNAAAIRMGIADGDLTDTSSNGFVKSLIFFGASFVPSFFLAGYFLGGYYPGLAVGASTEPSWWPTAMQYAHGVPKGTLAENVARVEAKEKIAAEAKAKAEAAKKAARAAARAAKADQPLKMAVPRAFKVAAAASQVSANLAAKEAAMKKWGKVKVLTKRVVPGNNANYVIFGMNRHDVSDGLDMQWSAKASNDVHLALMPKKAARTADCWEIVLGGWGNTRSVIRSGTQGLELTAVQDKATVGPNTRYRTFFLSYDEDSHVLSIWNDMSADGEGVPPLMSATMPALSSTKLYTAYGAWDTDYKTLIANYIDNDDFDDYVAAEAKRVVDDD